jgi:hypothetical protein
MINMLLSVAVFALVKCSFLGVFGVVRNKRDDNLLHQTEAAIDVHPTQVSSGELKDMDCAA